jgi:hypothetical protein
MSTDRDPIEPTREDLGIPTARGAAERTADRVADRAADDVSDGERVVERSIQREMPRETARAASTDSHNGERAALFEQSVLSEFNTRWTDIQTGFVDEPRRAVQNADALVQDVIKRIADSFGNERSQLEGQWDRGDEVSTEDLRVALQRYRSFFSRLLSL